MEGKKLYVGNLDYSVTKDELSELFSEFGEVVEVTIIDGKGFGFVEMSESSEAENAMGDLNGKDLKGRTMKVDEARPKRDNQRNFRR
ncbi:MAG TPA: RNA-binding protein [Candidatus Cloacimonetes bacterium]|jgi:RNA recognition motif-containing protein|nr:RNA-binding protein [Candidatus Cloacimonadota bacterium]